MSRPIALPTVCPHCGGRMSADHTRDTGDAATLPDGACSALFARRRPAPATSGQ